ncbi:[3-methyl-2-oxobutanoate dehydrogenase [lipoamide]] kinase, mitochondrial [Trichoplax sp. H2]|nr:[3-methyl-2-oxobutanoate dehydrogenase [lipoamide]] kinase, mitochondrial [Trichoplax sp. H2]|eukprot:RDD43021.1 [3-methyl-2-oxobutanoate dehydrogenase [lipoamide]] kinase, mitochondrial [Trichoplax sp. H2]
MHKMLYEIPYKMRSITRSCCLINNLLKYRYRDVLIRSSSWSSKPSLDQLMATPITPITPYQVLFAGNREDGSHLMKSAKFLVKELLVRFSHLIATMQNLPYIAMCHPQLKSVLESYHNSFDMLYDYETVNDYKAAVAYSKTLTKILEKYNDELKSLASGFDSAYKSVAAQDHSESLDKILKWYLGIKILAEHYVALHHPKPKYVGIICTKLELQDLIKAKADFAREICDFKYGRSPNVEFDGDVNCHFPYFPAPLEYIVFELLKNAFEATVKNHPKLSDNLPNVKIAISNTKEYFYIRISDQGGGMAKENASKAMKYHYTTSRAKNTALEQNIFNSVMEIQFGGPAGGPMSGYGFGLPVSRIYAEYLGGSLQLHTIPEYGTDVYLELQHIDGKNCFKI